MRPLTTLFLLQSIDGKISTGTGEIMDISSDFPKIEGLKEGLSQYYELEQKTNLCSLNSGKVQAKTGVNSLDLNAVQKIPVDFVVIDSAPHLTAHGCEYFARRSKRFILVTSNPSHPVFATQKLFDNIFVIYFEKEIDFKSMFRQLAQEFEIPRVTVQTGGTLNAEFLRLGLIDELSVIIAPCLIGGAHTPSLVDGISLTSHNQLGLIQTFDLAKVTQLNHSYLHLQYVIRYSGAK